MLEIFILSIVQGITEFLPISSSAHINLISKLTNFSFSGLLMDISLHVGSFFAVLIYFRKEIFEMLRNFKKLSYLVAAVLPILILGFLVSNMDLADNLRSLKVIGWMTIIFGILLFMSDKSAIKKNYKSEFNLKDALIIGLIHSIAIIPGVSRSGVAITACRFLSYSRVDSAKISFLISIPTLLAVSIYGIYSLNLNKDIELQSLSILSILGSFFFSYITIKYFLIYLRKFNLNLIVGYRIVFGVMVLLITYL